MTDHFLTDTVVHFTCSLSLLKTLSDKALWNEQETDNTVLQQLEIFDTKIVSLSDDAFAKLLQLQVLDLRNNRLETIGRSLFSRNTMLQRIDLSSNRIARIEFEFGSLDRLSRLNVGNNPFDVLTSTVWKLYMTNTGQLARSLTLNNARLRCNCEMGWMWDEKLTVTLEGGSCTRVIDDLRDLGMICIMKKLRICENSIVLAKDYCILGYYT